MSKIAILTERMKVGFGVDLVVHEQAKRLAKKHDVVIFPIEAEESFIQRQRYDVHKLSIPLAFNPIKQDFISFKKLKEYRKLLSLFDTIIIHTPTFHSWLPFLPRTSQIIVAFYGNSPSYGLDFPRNQRKFLLDTFENLLYFNFANKLCTISNFLKQSLPVHLQRKTSVLYLGSDHIRECNTHITSSVLAAFKKKYFLDSHTKVVSYIGRLDYVNNPYKNTKFLLQINQSLKKRFGTSFKLLAVGFPENQIEKEMFNQGIGVIPKASEQDLVSVLRLSSVFVSPSQWEGFNLPLLEAQTVGTPVVAFNVGAHKEVVDNGKSGFLVESKTDFIHKVTKILTDARLQKSLGTNGSLFAKNFSWNRNVSQLETLLEQK